MMSGFDHSTVDVNVSNVLVSRGVSEKYSRKIMSIQLATPFTSLFDADP
jgi:hypothetical protein